MKAYSCNTGGHCICFAGPEEKDEALVQLGFPLEVDEERPDHRATRFEGHNGYDYMAVDMPVMPRVVGESQLAELYCNGKALLIVSDGKMRPVQQTHDKLAAEEAKSIPTPGRALYLFFYALLASDAAYLEELEDEISALEDRVTKVPPQDCSQEIGDMRRRLLVLKRYYDALFDLLEDLEENDNGFLSKAELRNLRLHTGRADRLSNSITSLRDYVTQVREVYQNQLDLSLNQTMKVLSVLSAIFFPLSLIAAWYGMNFNMPEYGAPWAYPLLIVICIVLVAATFLFFRRKKWF